MGNTLRLQEQDFVSTELTADEERVILDEMPRPDFEIRNLGNYSADDLLALLNAVSMGHVLARRSGDHRSKEILDVWCYRIRDAYKNAVKREDLPFLNHTI